MGYGGDELAGVVDLFGALTRAELRDALAELAFKAGEDHDPEAFEEPVAEAVSSYHLVPVSADAVSGAVDAEEVLVPGPIAFEELPENAEDLPHIVDVKPRSVDRERAAEAAETRFREDAATAVAAGDPERISTLLDVSYELEVWGPVDLEAARTRLDDAMA